MQPEVHKLANSLVVDHACTRSALQLHACFYEHNVQKITNDLELVQVAGNLVDANNASILDQPFSFCQYMHYGI